MRIQHPDVVDGTFVHDGVAYVITGGVLEGPAALLSEIHGAVPASDDPAATPVTQTVAPPEPAETNDEKLARMTVSQIVAALADITDSHILEQIEASELSGKKRKGVLEAIAERQQALADAAALGAAQAADAAEQAAKAQAEAEAQAAAANAAAEGTGV